MLITNKTKAIKLKIGIFLLFLISASSVCFTQMVVRGKVLDFNTNKPLAFVNICFNNEVTLGTTTDIDGNFSLPDSIKIYSLNLSHVGYEKLTVDLDSFVYSGKPFIIKIKPKDYILQEVVIVAGENPANRIIRKVIDNKKINNPENLYSFQYESYNKIIYDFIINPSSPNKDTIRNRLEKTFKGGHASIMESITERRFLKPDNDQETILANKVSGFQNPSFGVLATSIQSFSLYKDLITIFDINYLNPISKGSLNKYQFNIEDTLYDKTDTIYIISFRPRPNKNYDALKGLLYINTNKYALQNIIAQPFESGLVDIKFQQKYEYIDNKQWFPVQLNFELIATEYPSKELGMLLNGRSYIKNINLSPDIEIKDFGIESIILDETAFKKGNRFWNKYRSDSLSYRELKTYEVLDSLGRKYKFDAKLKIVEKIYIGRVPLSLIDLDLAKILKQNKYEGLRIGLGGHTNERISETFSIGGYACYGLKDKKWKYGGHIRFMLNKKNEIQFILQYLCDVEEPGRTNLNFENNKFSYRDFLTFQMDKIEEKKAEFSFRAFNYAKLNISLSQCQKIPSYEYKFISETNNSFQTNIYNYTDLHVQLKYAYKEKLTKYLDQKASLGTSYPILYLHYTKGIRNFLNGQFDYDKIEVSLEKIFISPNLGEIRFRIDGGYIWGNIPYSNLFIGNGSFSNNFSVFVKNSFQTMQLYEFLSDKYINLYVEHDFGSLLFKTKKFKPKIMLVQNIGFGTLTNISNHKEIKFKTLEKGFYETGIQIDNILRFKYVNIAYIGLGTGVYYNYGPYSLADNKENIAFKLSMTFSSK